MDDVTVPATNVMNRRRLVATVIANSMPPEDAIASGLQLLEQLFLHREGVGVRHGPEVLISFGTTLAAALQDQECSTQVPLRVRVDRAEGRFFIQAAPGTTS